MNKKRGISPLIATVLIIGFTIALAAVIMTWGSGFIKGMQKETEETAEKTMITATGVGFKIKDAEVKKDELRLLIENQNKMDIESFLVRIYGKDGTDTITINDKIEAYNIKKITAMFNVSAIGQVEEVEVLPVVNIKGELVTVSNVFDSKKGSAITGYDKNIQSFDEFDTFDESRWTKSTGPGASIENINGEMVLTGTGSNYNSNFYSDLWYARNINPVFKVDFRVNTITTDTIFHVATEGWVPGSGYYRRHGIQVRSNGLMRAQWYSPSTGGGTQIIKTNTKANTWYTLEIEFSSIGSKLYVYEKGHQKPSTPIHEITVSDWPIARFHFWIYREQGFIDNAEVYVKW